MGRVNGMKLLIAEPSHKKVKGVSTQSGFSSKGQDYTVRSSGKSLTPLNLHSSVSRAAVSLLSKSKGNLHPRQRWSFRKANNNNDSQSEWQVRGEGDAARVESNKQHIKHHFSFQKQGHKLLHEAACLSVPDVYYVLHVHGCWSDGSHTKLIRTHTSVTLFPIVDPWSSVRWSWGHVTVFVACVAGFPSLCYGLWITPHWAHTDLVIRNDIVQFSSKIYCDDWARNLYTFHFFIGHWFIFLYCVVVHVYLFTECIYWYEMHSYCYLCIAKFI